MFGQKSSMDPNGSHWIGIVPGSRKTRFEPSTFGMTSPGLLGVCFVLCVFNVLTLFLLLLASGTVSENGEIGWNFDFLIFRWEGGRSHYPLL